MSKLERLDEALAHFLAREPEVPFDLHDSLRAIIDAARAYRDLLANGQRVEWCEEHRLLVRWEDAATCAAGAYSNNCRIVSRLLSLYPKEAENG